MAIYQGNIALTNGSGGMPEIFIATYGVTTYTEIKEAYDAGKVCFCSGQQLMMQLENIDSSTACFVFTANGMYMDFSVSASTNQWTTRTHNFLFTDGGTMTGALTLSGAPTANLHAATKQYVDNAMASVISQAFHAGSTAPSDTKLLWIDTGNGSIMKYHNGSAWTIVGSTWG